ncbi:MAG: phosphonate ABC transporter, permease protein PhnE [Chloroflexi bacterium]|nr:phosphonate ABC transporter, permease protein PhnE [Chloroflexota bacterium]
MTSSQSPRKNDVEVKEITLSPRAAALLSLFIPGGGQVAQGARARGWGFFLGILVTAGLTIWMQLWGALAIVAIIWAWNIFDAYRLAKKRPLRLWIPVLLGAAVVYAAAFSATQFRIERLITGWPSMKPYVRALFHPELLTYPTEDLIGSEPIMVPCVDPLPPPAREGSETPNLTIDKPCAEVGERITLTGEGFFPNFEGELWWINPIGDRQRVLIDGEPMLFVTDDEGRFQVSLEVPLAVPLSELPGPGETQTHFVRAEQHKPYGNPIPTQTLSLVLEKIGETVALAFLATVLGVVFAVPVSFLAARNLMNRHPLTRAIYYVVRTILNIVRSIETLMWAIIFAVWVGLGPFGGMLALWLHTVAALGKLYSEAIESIDPGPIEAVRATGAREPQVIVYAVLPQILPAFTSFTLYRWDINVRMSTVIGLISDAGLGFLVIQWIRLNRFSSMATAIIAIVLVITTLDFASAQLRKRIIEGAPTMKPAHPVRRAATIIVSIVAFVLLFGWSWRVAQVDLTELVRGAPEGLRLALAFATPDIITRPTEEFSVSQPLPVPCGVADVESKPLTGPRVSLSRTCGEVGEPLTIIGHALPPNTDVSIRWVLPDGAFLRVKSNCCTTDASGTVRVDTTIHPLMEVDPETAATQGVGQVAIVWKQVVGPPTISENAKRVVELALVTLLMALVATTLGAMVAIPLSFFAARNIMGTTRLGKIVYVLFRSGFNIFRAIEPMILVLIAAAWVGAGPFAGVLALALNNIPNLGKLFSETIEDIDAGPVEAVTATGATRLQVLVYAVAPQLVPPFLAFILYQWDINIRMSTVIGFVGGGGIGQQFRIWVGLNQYAAAGTAVLAIIFMVWSMDYLSSKARERLV